MSQRTKASEIKEFLINLVFVIFCCWVLFFFVSYLSVLKAASEIRQPEQQEFIRVRLYGSSSSPDGNTVSAAFSIVDTAGNEIAAIERSWSGNYLSVDFVETSIRDKYFIFPVSIYGKQRILETKKDKHGGTLLEKYYDDNGQCLLLGYGSSLYERQALYKIARFAMNRFLIIPRFGHTTTYSVDLSECKTDVYYSIQILPDGRIVVMEI